MPTERSRLRSQSKLHAATDHFPYRGPSKALCAMNRWWRGKGFDIFESCCSAKLAKASGCKRGFMSDVAIPIVPTKRAHRVGHAQDQDATRAKRIVDAVQRLKNLGLCQVLEEICGRHNVERIATKALPIVPEFNLRDPGRMCEFDLLRADVDASRILITMVEKLSHKSTLPAAKVDYCCLAPDWQVREDASPKSDFTSRFVCCPRVCCRVCLVKPTTHFIVHSGEHLLLSKEIRGVARDYLSPKAYRHAEALGTARPLGAACAPVAPKRKMVKYRASPPIVESSVPNRKHPDDGQCNRANTNNARPFPFGGRTNDFGAGRPPFALWTASVSAAPPRLCAVSPSTK